MTGVRSHVIQNLPHPTLPPLTHPPAMIVSLLATSGLQAYVSRHSSVVDVVKTSSLSRELLSRSLCLKTFTLRGSSLNGLVGKQSLLMTVYSSVQVTIFQNMFSSYMLTCKIVSRKKNQNITFLHRYASLAYRPTLPIGWSHPNVFACICNADV